MPNQDNAIKHHGKIKSKILSTGVAIVNLGIEDTDAGNKSCNDGGMSMFIQKALHKATLES
jgi:hypothetical protein